MQVNAKQTISTRLIVANLLAVIVAMLGGGVGIISLEKSVSRYAVQVRELQDAQINILRTESYFKIQVQEWKDVLLRGKDPVQRELYWNAFQEREAMVHETASNVVSGLPADANAGKQLVLEFLDAHHKLFDAYRKGFNVFNDSGGNPYLADAVVKGVDRTPTELLNKAVKEISEEVLAIQADADAKADSALKVAFGAMIAALMGSVAVFGVMLRKAKQMEEALGIAAVAFESREGILVTEENNIIVQVNRSFTELTGYESDEAIGKKPTLLKSGRHDGKFYDDMWQLIQRDGFWQGEIWNRRKNGEIYPEWLTITAVRDSKGRIKHYVGSFSDITRRVADEAEIRNLAFYDPLTRLANRRLLTDRLSHAFALSHRSRNYGALLFLDLDRFKTLNDTLGHAQGDHLLELVAERLTSCVREEDTVARFGGDEFVILFEALGDDPKSATSKVMQLAEKLRASLDEPYNLQDGTGRTNEWHCTASIGATLFLGHEQDVDSVLAQADRALYAAKESGRNTVRLAEYPESQRAG